MQQHKGPEFFLGGHMKAGFLSLFSQLQAASVMDHAYILKGGPGSGKSTLMRRLGEALEARGDEVEWIPCASDPDSLDAVYDRTTRRAVLDGTAPHVQDPFHPGAVQTLVNVGEAWSEAELRGHRDDIVRLTGEIGSRHARADAYISAAAALLSRVRGEAAEFVSEEAVAALSAHILADIPEGRGREEERLLSAVSVGRIAFFGGTLQSCCVRLYTVEDRWGAGAAALMAALRARAGLAGIDRIVCVGPIEPALPEHLIFPAASVGVCTINRFHSVEHPGRIEVEGFYRPIPEEKKAALAVLEADAAGLIERACDAIAEAKTLHDDLEKFYIGAMDFSQMETRYQNLFAAMTE